MSDAVGFHKIVPTFPVADVTASVRFYVDLLGFTLGGRPSDGFASVFRGEGAAVTLYLRLRAEPFGTAECFVLVDDPDALHAACVRASVPVAEEPHDAPWGYRQFTVRDPDGHVLHLFRYLADA